MPATNRETRAWTRPTRSQSPGTDIIRVGDAITYVARDALEVTAVVIQINLCPRQGDKYGDDVPSILWDRRAYGYFRIRGGGFVYGRDIRASFDKAATPDVT